jgi:hypothetical protein
MPSTDTAELIEEIDRVIAESMQLFGDHDALEAKRLEQAALYKRTRQ